MTNRTLFMTIAAVSTFVACFNAQSAPVTKLEYGNESGWIRFTEDQPLPKPVTPRLKIDSVNQVAINSAVTTIVSTKDNAPLTGLTGVKPTSATTLPVTTGSINQNAGDVNKGVTAPASGKPPTNPLLTTNVISTAKSVTTVKAPSKIWRIDAGSMLKDAIYNWAAEEKCSVPGVETWNVVWLTQIKYRVDAPLQFTGDFRTALNSLFTLYGSAKVPLYAGIRSGQCLISVDDKEIH